MRITNNTGLPEPLVKMAERLVNSHPAGSVDTFSVTEMLKSVRQSVLARRSEITRDVQDTAALWIGTAVHDALEREGIDNPELVTETRLYTKLGDYTLSGEFDMLETLDDTIVDYKTSMVSRIEKNREVEADKWIRQLYAYAYLLERNGKPRPKKGTIVAIALDFSKVKAATQKDYPQQPIQMLTWPLDDEEFMNSVIDGIENNMEEASFYLRNPDAELPLCSYSDCWCKEDYAIMKPGAKKALKVFRDEGSARLCYEAMPNRDDVRIFHRVSDFMNCRLYCDCAQFCDQWQKNKDFEAFSEDITDAEELPF